MNPVDLKKFALHSQKIPPNFLLFPKKTNGKIPLAKILCAHFIDFISCIVVTASMSQLYNSKVTSFLITNDLHYAFSLGNTAGLALLMLPATLFCYFFMSYFMNDGQTLGMHLLKLRVTVKSKNFVEALEFAFHSLALCFSTGAYYVLKNDPWKKFQAHDYLYLDLILPSDIQNIDLLKEIERLQSSQDSFSDYEEAA